jgi:hypothetical protein
VKTIVGRPRAREHKPAMAVGAPVAKPGSDRLADIDRERQPLVTTALAGDNQLARAPVQILKPQRGDLANAHPEPR